MMSSSAMDVFASVSGPAASTAVSLPSLFLTRAAKSLADMTQLLIDQQPQTQLSTAAFLSPLFRSRSHSSLFEITDTKQLQRSIRATLGTTQPAPFPQIIGHRGALYEELENTLASFDYCAQIGCHAVELDVFWLGPTTDKSLDNLICFHGGGDDDLSGELTDYCLGHDGKSILDLDLKQALELLFDPNQPEFACPPSKIVSAKVPTLRQVLERLKDTPTKVTIELKGPHTVQPCILLVEELNMVDKVVFSSFDLNKLQQVQDFRPNVYNTAALFDEIPDDYMEQALRVHANQIHLRYDTCTVDRIARIHAAGLGSMAWFRGPVGMAMDAESVYMDMGNEDESCYQAVLNTGVQQLCCNKPNVLKEILVKSNRYKLE